MSTGIGDLAKIRGYHMHTTKTVPVAHRSRFLRDYESRLACFRRLELGNRAFRLSTHQGELTRATFTTQSSHLFRTMGLLMLGAQALHTRMQHRQCRLLRICKNSKNSRNFDPIPRSLLWSDRSRISKIPSRLQGFKITRNFNRSRIPSTPHTFSSLPPPTCRAIHIRSLTLAQGRRSSELWNFTTRWL